MFPPISVFFPLDCIPCGNLHLNNPFKLESIELCNSSSLISQMGHSNFCGQVRTLVTTCSARWAGRRLVDVCLGDFSLAWGADPALWFDEISSQYFWLIFVVLNVGA